MGGGGVHFYLLGKQYFLNLIFSSRFMLFPTFIERKQNSGGGGSVPTKFVVLAAEPVGERSRATELPCQN